LGRVDLNPTWPDSNQKNYRLIYFWILSNRVGLTHRIGSIIDTSSPKFVDITAYKKSTYWVAIAAVTTTHVKTLRGGSRSLSKLWHTENSAQFLEYFDNTWSGFLNKTQTQSNFRLYFYKLTEKIYYCNACF
jgi:hypothetical protein